MLRGQGFLRFTHMHRYGHILGTDRGGLGSRCFLGRETWIPSTCLPVEPGGLQKDTTQGGLPLETAQTLGIWIKGACFVISYLGLVATGSWIWEECWGWSFCLRDE